MGIKTYAQKHTAERSGFMKYGYARVSSIVQLKGNSLEEQTAELLKAGVSADCIVTEQYTGKTLKRPKFKQLIDALQPGDELICCKLDRFARNAEDGLKTVRELLERGIIIRILNIGNGQPFDNSPMGQLLFTMLLAFAQFERELILERTAAGKAIAKTKDGFRDGRPPIPNVRIQTALSLLKDHTYKEVVQMTSISRATLARYKKQACCEANQ